MYVGLHVKYPLFLSDFKTFEFSQNIFEKFSITSFHKNPSNANRVVPCGQTDITKLIIAFRKFANASKIVTCLYYVLY